MLKPIMPHTHSPAELATLERSTGLELGGYLAADEPRTLLPILGRADLSAAQRRCLVLGLNRAELAEAAQVEKQGRQAG